MAPLDCLFLHVPKLKNYYRPIDQFIWINFLPMGLLGLADLLSRHQISTEVVHLGVEWIEDHHFSILDYLKEKNPKIVALDLHWHHQSYDVLEVARKVKEAFPSLYLLLGGFTASFFHEEILRNFDVVDGVIRGEAETPILELAQLVKRLVGSPSEIVHVPYMEAYGADFEETRRRVPDVRKAERVLGFRTEILLEEGLRRTIDWFQSSVVAS